MGSQNEIFNHKNDIQKINDLSHTNLIMKPSTMKKTKAQSLEINDIP